MYSHFGPALCVDIVPVFAHPWCQYIKIVLGINFGANTCGTCIHTRANTGEYSWRIIYVLVSCQGVSWVYANRAIRHAFFPRSPLCHKGHCPSSKGSHRETVLDIAWQRLLGSSSATVLGSRRFLRRALLEFDILIGPVGRYSDGKKTMPCH